MRGVVLAGLVMAAPAAFAEDMPAFVAGKTFETVLLQFDGQNWPGTFRFSEVIDPDQPSELIYEEMGCASNLFAVEHDELRVVFKQRLTEGKGKCGDLGYVEVRFDQVMNAMVFGYSMTRAMHPQIVRGMLFEPGKGGDFEARKAMTEEVYPEPPFLWGSYQNVRDFFLDTCAMKMPVEGKDFLPTDARGAITLWSVPTETGGQMGAVYQAGDPRELRWKVLRHFRDGTYVADDGLFDIEGRVYLEPGFSDLGIGALTVAPEGGDRFSYRQYFRCE